MYNIYTEKYLYLRSTIYFLKHINHGYFKGHFNNSNILMNCGSVLFSTFSFILVSWQDMKFCIE